MICDVCGRNNADNLTFCQDCGRRLRQHRGVAPTPPNGMPVAVAIGNPVGVPQTPPVYAAAAPQPVPQTPPVYAAAAPQPVGRDGERGSSNPSGPESGRGSSPSGPPSGGRRARPAAPVFSFAPQVATDPPPAPVLEPPPAAQPAPLPAQRAAEPALICQECQSPNPAQYRFCVTCGASLARRSPVARAPVAVEPERRGPPPLPEPPVPTSSSVAAPIPAPAEGDKIVGAPVVDIAASGAVPVRLVTCSRCHGQCVAGTRFCKYCGSPLDAPPPVEAQRPPEPLGRVPLAPIGKAVPDAGRAPVMSAPPVSAGVRPALNPPTPLPLPVAAGGPLPSPAMAAAVPVHDEPVAMGNPYGVPQTPAVHPAPRLVALDGGAAPRPVAQPAPPRPVPVPRPAAAPHPPQAPRIEDAPAPGVRAEVSALAGSPVPAEPLIPSPPPPRDAVAMGNPAGVPQTPPDAARVGRAAHAARWKGGRLVVIVEDGSEGRSFSLAEGQLDIGRTDGDIVLEDDPYVSPRHARLRRMVSEGGAGQGPQATTWILRDLDSTNHVYVRLRKPHPLRDGDLLLLGLEVLQFQTVSDGERGLGHAIQHGTFLFGSPATPRRARLCQRTVEGVIRDVYHLFRDETIIGRELGDVVFTADPFLSRRHAAIRRNPVTSEFSLVDLDSSNGTYVAIRGEVAISDGDFLRIGQHLFRVDLG